MERLHVNHLQEVLERHRRGQSDRAIERDLALWRVILRKYRSALTGPGEEAALARIKGCVNNARKVIQCNARKLIHPGAEEGGSSSAVGALTARPTTLAMVSPHRARTPKNG